MTHILIVDDEPEFLRPHIETLTYAGYNTTLVTTPEAALQALDQLYIDVIILDLMLPPYIDEKRRSDFTVTGVRLHQDIRARIPTDIPIIFLSVIRDPKIYAQLAHREHEAGYELRFLTKPTSPLRVLKVVEEVLRPDQRPR